MSTGLAVMVKGVRCANGLNTIPFTSVLAEIETSEMEDESKFAVSAGPLGTVIGDQLSALFQLPLLGEVNQLALPANAESAAKNMSTVAAKRWGARIVAFISVGFQRAEGSAPGREK